MLYVLIALIRAFFEAGIVSCAAIRLNGGDPKFSDGIVKAKDNFKKIVYWAFIDGSVKLVLALFHSNKEKKKNYLAKYIGNMLDVAWKAITFFVVPVLVFENLNVIDSIKKSASIFKKTWGESAIASFSSILLILLFSWIGLLPLLLITLNPPGVVVLGLVAFALIYNLVLIAVIECLMGVYKAALYLYAGSGKVAEGFDIELIKNGFGKKE